MVILRSKELKEVEISELKSKLKDLQLELMKINLQRASKSVSSPGRVKEIRQSVAKILGELNARKAKHLDS